MQRPVCDEQNISLLNKGMFSIIDFSFCLILQNSWA